MNHRFRIVAWNCRRAALKSGVWDYLLELDPDVALLQEVISVPPSVLDVYASAEATAVTRTGGPQRFRTAVLVRGEIAGDVELPAPNEWVARELAFFRGNFVAKQVTLRTGLDLKVISAHIPAFPIDWSRLEGVDTTGIQLTQNRHVWPSEILWASLRSMGFAADEPFVVGGDFNSSETFDTLWSGGPRGNRELIDRMNALGLHECLRAFQGQLTPTFRSTRGGSVIHQLDHLYVTSALLRKLVRCDVGSAERVFRSTPSLSDHLPIVADFVAADPPSQGVLPPG